jgi:hypothetical protein
MKKRRGRKMSREKLFDKYRVEKGSKRQFQCKRCKAEWNIAGLLRRGRPEAMGKWVGSVQTAVTPMYAAAIRRGSAMKAGKSEANADRSQRPSHLRNIICLQFDQVARAVDRRGERFSHASGSSVRRPIGFTAASSTTTRSYSMRKRFLP